LQDHLFDLRGKGVLVDQRTALDHTTRKGNQLAGSEEQPFPLFDFRRWPIHELIPFLHPYHLGQPLLPLRKLPVEEVSGMI